ncbi:hypothetical protein G4313_07775 [Coprococcus eutactus]|nr:hypothetical protein [Coprococcus eutactus]
MKSINWQTIGYVILGIFMLICYAYIDGKEILKKIIPDYKLVNDNGYFEMLNDDGEMSIFCISKSVRGNAKNTYSFNYIDSWSDPPLEIVADKDVRMNIRIESENKDILFDNEVVLKAGKKQKLYIYFEVGETNVYVDSEFDNFDYILRLQF